MQRYNKFLAAVATAGTEALTLGLVPEPFAKYVAVAVGFLGALVVYRVPNADPVPDAQPDVEAQDDWEG